MQLNSIALPDASDDEYDNESREMIAYQINKNSTVNEIAEIISKVFYKSFDEKFEMKECMLTAEKIYQSLTMTNC